ncbi:MAG: hypothetical protein U0414_42215 [Polyangiaceae bacterium]
MDTLPRTRFALLGTFALTLASVGGCSSATWSARTGDGAPVAPLEPEARSASASDASRAPKDGRLAKFYAETSKITYATVTKEQLDPSAMWSRYLDRHGPDDEVVLAGENPDPQWITRWKPGKSMAFLEVGAWIQSRIVHSYAADLDAAYEAYRARWKALDDELEAKRGAALEKKDFYARTSALAALFKEGATRAKSLPGGKDGVRPGVLHTLALDIDEAYRKENLTWALADSRARVGFEGLRAWSDDARERKNFAALAMAGKVPELLPALPVVGYHDSLACLAWPEGVDPSKDEAFVLPADRALAKKPEWVSMGARYPDTALYDLSLETKDIVVGGAPKGEPRLVRAEGLVVALDPARDGGALVTLESRVTFSRDKCVGYGPITHVYDDGDVGHAYESCSTAEQHETVRRFVVTAKDWPSEIALGDWVMLSADVDTVKATGTALKSSVDVALTARFVSCFIHGEPLDRKARDYEEQLLVRTETRGGGQCAPRSW